VEVLKQIGRVRRRSPGRWMNALRLLALAAFIVALARPRLGSEHTEVQASGIDIMLAVDVSGSMEAMDFKLNGKRVTRIEAVKDVVARFIKDRPNDRIGLIAFAGKPYLMAPLTLDHEYLLKRLEQVSLGQIEDGTAIGSAAVSAVKRLAKQKAKSKIVVLLTDGMNNSGTASPEIAAETAKTLGIKIYTIGAGTRGQAPIPVKDMWGRRHLTMAKVDIDEKTLQKMADATGGKYFRATDTDSLQKIYDVINKLEKTKRKIQHFSNYHEIFAWVLVPGLFFLALELALAATRYRRVP
jgi:Ca-activated chloride channel family protein